ncbi:hypothetical protein PPL_00943 [Heterostelium album PN500]|uniref:Uncharacterized protein n=1 Tax=Heterostelium pallidum (strain ATCC 26659 / Pp 5 / PN500) TaxID=670386 RepID=D3AXN6_HETP5|nr:hypothetical protein PPL_00943 [Heterostelium album PN500]EFA85713.1 hypothetical protein PPL_00943 [Heterostelium album PN500]|eukprot:XP_020437819.1 hypothetical protein PPL_00943 [Heterostelium album PN500]
MLGLARHIKLENDEFISIARECIGFIKNAGERDILDQYRRRYSILQSKRVKNTINRDHIEQEGREIERERREINREEEYIRREIEREEREIESIEREQELIRREIEREEREIKSIEREEEFIRREFEREDREIKSIEGEEKTKELTSEKEEESLKREEKKFKEIEQKQTNQTTDTNNNLLMTLESYASTTSKKRKMTSSTSLLGVLSQFKIEMTNVWSYLEKDCKNVKESLRASLSNLEIFLQPVKAIINGNKSEVDKDRLKSSHNIHIFYNLFHTTTLIGDLSSIGVSTTSEVSII